MIAEDFMQKGKLEAKREIARNMLRKGLDIDLIVEVTELSQEEVEHLAEEVKTETEKNYQGRCALQANRF